MAEFADTQMDHVAFDVAGNPFWIGYVSDRLMREMQRDPRVARVETMTVRKASEMHMAYVETLPGFRPADPAGQE